MCYDRLINDDEVAETSMAALFRSELRCALRNGAMAAGIVLVVLLVEGTPAWLVLGSAAGALALGALLHQAVLLAGAGVLRARARWRSGRRQRAA
ncbi:hypothetical protein [Haloarcula sediminis]|uniref:hypothetical protein n=1 Tax=Haloarcula sediminis TaxID=3111777 RepID=UPI002D776CA4|nr:hypothetical protein [Haloarcula sp. CK38]